MRDFLQLSVTATTLYATLPMIVSVLMQNFIWGPLSDKLQKRRTFIILGEILAGIGTISVWGVHFLVSNLLIAGYIIIIGLSCTEAFWGMSNIGWTALISDLYPSEKRSKIMGQLSSIGGLGRIIGITIGGFLYDGGWGFRNGLLFFAASFVMFISTIPMLFAPEGGINVPELKKESQLKNTINNNLTTRLKLIFFIFIISLVFINFGRNSISVTYSQFLILDSSFNVDSILLSFITNTRSLAVLSIGLLVGALSKRIGYAYTLISGTLIAIIALLMTALTNSLFFIFVGSFLIGTGEVIIYSSSYSIASNLIPKKIRAKLFGVYNTTFFLSWGLAGTIIAGPLIDVLILNGFTEVFSYQMSFIMAAIITGIGLLIYTLLEFKLRKTEEI